MSALVPDPRDEFDNPYPEHEVDVDCLFDRGSGTGNLGHLGRTVEFDPGSAAHGFSSTGWVGEGGHHSYMITPAGADRISELGMGLAISTAVDLGVPKHLEYLVLMFVEDSEPTAIMVAGSFAQLGKDAKAGVRALETLYQLEKKGYVV